LEHHEEFVISLLSEDDEMLKEDDIASLHLDVDNDKLELLHRQFKKRSVTSTSPEEEQEEEEKIPTPQESYDKKDFSLKIW